MVERILSGGQSGVDRAALDVALELAIPCGGWCPRGRRAEDGVIDERYPLTETPSDRYAQRTLWNVRDSDGTLIILGARLSRGTALTRRLALKLRKPHHVVRLPEDPGAEAARAWLIEHRIRTVNIAGPRASESPGIYEAAQAWLRGLLAG